MSNLRILLKKNTINILYQSTINAFSLNSTWIWIRATGQYWFILFGVLALISVNNNPSHVILCPFFILYRVHSTHLLRATKIHVVGTSIRSRSEVVWITSCLVWVTSKRRSSRRITRFTADMEISLRHPPPSRWTLDWTEVCPIEAGRDPGIPSKYWRYA